MEHLTRFGVSIDTALLKRFDRLIAVSRYKNRSEAFRDLIRGRLAEKLTEDENREALGALTMVYDHHQTHVAQRMKQLQHDHHEWIISTTHVHIDHATCLEVILLRGKIRDVRMLASGLTLIKGVLHHHLTITPKGAF